MKISVVIPLFNEEGNISELYQRLHSVMNALVLDFEIIFVDDNSTDASAQLVDAIAQRDPAVTCIRLRTHSGKEEALYSGFVYSRGETIVVLDSDLQNFPEDIPSMITALNSVDAVIGWRRDRYDGTLKKLTAWIGNAVRRFVLKDSLHDAGCGLRAFKRKCLSAIGPYKLYEYYLMPILQRKGFSITELVVRHASRKSGKSNFNIRNRIFSQAITLLVVWWLLKNDLTKQDKTDK